jgi:hypothetical protein
VWVQHSAPISYTLKILEVCASETLMTYQTTRCHVTEVYSQNVYCYETLQSRYTSGLFYQLDVQILMFPAAMEVHKV